MGEERVLDLGHRDILPAADDHVLGPPGDGDVPVAIERRAIPRLEPAVGGMALAGELRALPVPDELRGSLDEEITLAACGDLAFGVVDDAQGHAGEREAIGA